MFTGTEFTAGSGARRDIRHLEVVRYRTVVWSFGPTGSGDRMTSSRWPGSAPISDQVTIRRSVETLTRPSRGLRIFQPLRQRFRRRTKDLGEGTGHSINDVHGLSVQLFAHDLRSPLLASRRAVLDLLDGPRSPDALDPQSDEAACLLASLERSLEQIDHLMVDILELASLPVTEMAVETFFARELTELVRDECSERDRVRARVAPTLRVTGNRILLMRALLNLVENGLRYTTGDVLVDLSRSAGGLLILVDDHGSGVPPALRDAIFEPLTRVDPETSQGSGLGLTLVRRVAEAHGGLAGVEAAPTGGARFVLWVPEAHPARS